MTGQTNSVSSSLSFVFKLASRCNLNCNYCYVYNKQDTSWRGRPKEMSYAVFQAAIGRIRRHCERSGQKKVRLVFHGGEPALIGTKKFSDFCSYARDTLKHVELRLSIQTNGTLIDAEWAAVLKEYGVDVGISLDGPQEVNDKLRVNHSGKGSYRDVSKAIAQLRNSGVSFHILSVIQFGADGVRNYRHFVDLGADSIDFLFPDYTHDNIGAVRAVHGATPCSDYLIPVFDDWWFNGNLAIPIRIFWTISRILLGGGDEIDLFGNKPLRFMFVETDGAIEGLDVLRVCEEGKASTGLNVGADDFIDIGNFPNFHNTAIFLGMPLPDSCNGCAEMDTCGGGYLPHRYAARSGFNNRSVWCEDIKKIFHHLRNRLEVSHQETQARRAALQQVKLNLMSLT